ncbi:hypothetical protein IT402_02075 [Candidatus Nomurabacteria bacterium]|nr:hypothetical protein [Candidatus Nomurabacteria bacterium]
MKINKNQTQKGNALMITIILFVVIATSISMGLAAPTISSVKSSKDAIESKRSYAIAESGVEDVFYRLKTNKNVSTTETINIGSQQAVTTVTDISGGRKQINSVGDSSSRNRIINLIVQQGTGVSFNYGVLVGQGGLELSGSGTINGNVYANGPITGDSSAVITGTAISGNSPSLTADQSNGSGVPAYDVVFGNSGSTQDIAQSFQVSTESPLNKLQFYIKKNGSPSNATVKIVNDSSGSPGSSVLASGTLTASSVTTSYGWVDISFNSNPILSMNTIYWIVIDASSSASKYYIVGANNAGYANGVGKIGSSPSTWNNTSPSGLDYFFKVFLGGVNGLIAGSSGSQWNQLHIGTISGTAQANTVNYVNSTGDIYCQNGTGNNKACISQPDPVYQQFPVSEANITQWKDEAASGGVYTGNYSVGWAGAILGPKKIVGDLSVGGGGTLTLTGPLWVTGNITLNGGGTIELSPSYSTNDGVIVSDGTISISGGGHATGSGTAGSYLMMLSTSYSSNAISISGGAGAVIAYAQNGTISISGGAALKEATGYRITVSGGSSITYESGLSNNNFSSGPGGSWNISSWREQ